LLFPLHGSSVVTRGCPFPIRLQVKHAYLQGNSRGSRCKARVRSCHTQARMLCYFVNRMWPLRETKHRAGTAALSALGCYLSSPEIERQRWDSCFRRDCICLPALITSCFGGNLEGGGRARSSRLRSMMAGNARDWRSPRALGHGIGAPLFQSTMWEGGVQDVVLLLLLC
jgi:hypothetical protein